MAKKTSLVGIVITLVGVAGFIAFFVPRLADNSGGSAPDAPPDGIAMETNGSWLQGLKESAEGAALETDLLKKNYYVIFDSSGSMAEEEKLPTAKKAVIEFMRHVPPDANLGLAVFDDDGLSERVALQENRQKFMAQINGAQAAGSTPLRDSLELAYKKLSGQAVRQLGYGEYVIVVITDGEASSGHEPDRIVNRILSESPIVIHTIGFKIGDNHSLNQPGRIYYTAANDYDELSRGLTGVLAESESFTVADFKK